MTQCKQRRRSMPSSSIRRNLLDFITHGQVNSYEVSPSAVFGQAVVTGVVPFPPRYMPSTFIAHRVQHSHCSSIFIECCLLTEDIRRNVIIGTYCRSPSADNAAVPCQVLASVGIYRILERMGRSTRRKFHPQQSFDKPWSRASFLLPPGTCLRFLSRIGFSIPTARRFSSSVASSRSRAFR